MKRKKTTHHKSGPKHSSRPSPGHEGGFKLKPNQRWVVGIHAAREAILVRPRAIDLMILRADWRGHPDLTEFAEWAKANRINVQTVSEEALTRLCRSHQGVALAVTGAPELDPKILEGDGPVILMALDQVTDPHNLGAVLRTAWLMGVKALIVPASRSSHLTPAATKVASGGAEHVPLVVESHLPNYLESLKKQGFWSYGLAPGGKNNLWQIEYPSKVVWVVGSEDKGIRSSVANTCDELVSIPQVEKRASYNASVAAAIALAETRRQHKSP